MTDAAKTTLWFLSAAISMPKIDIPHVSGTTAGEAMSSVVLAIIDLGKKAIQGTCVGTGLVVAVDGNVWDSCMLAICGLLARWYRILGLGVGLFVTLIVGLVVDVLTKLLVNVFIDLPVTLLTRFLIDLHTVLLVAMLINFLVRMRVRMPLIYRISVHGCNLSRLWTREHDGVHAI